MTNWEGAEVFDEVHVISDLHWGGARGAEIFAGAGEMAMWIERLAAVPSRVALVFGGDIVDFIAGPSAVYFRPDDAITWLDAALDGVRPVLDALGRFIQQPDHKVVFLRGNHDVELALPWVAKRLVWRLSGSEAHPHVDTLGLRKAQGFRCLVDDRRVFVIHGNDQDPHNPVDQAALERVRDAWEAREAVWRKPDANADKIREAQQKYGRAMASWKPNLGTRLVVDVLNFVKGRRPFIDLLKPESPGDLAAILIALNPLNALAVLPMIPGAKVWAVPLLESLRGRGLLSRVVGDGAADDLVPVALPHGSTALIDTVLQDLQAGRRPLDVLGDETSDQMLGFKRAISRALLGMSRDDALREGMRDWLSAHEDFDTPAALSLDDSAIERANEPGADFLIAGHTHIARCAPRPGGGGWYLNTGTWIRLVKLRARDLDSESDWTHVRQMLEAPTIAALDALPDLVASPRNVVSIVADGRGPVGTRGVVGRLGQINGDGSFQEITNTQKVEVTR